jgi:hypothetical protein
VDTHNAVPALPAAGGISRCKEALPFVRHDVARLREVQEILERYGLFDRGLDFGPSAIQEGGPREKALARSYAVERRFLLLGPRMTYSSQPNYGWLDTAGISSSPAIPLPNFTSRGSRSSTLLLPSDALYRDFLRGKAKSMLLLGVPDGGYRVTAILANQVELAAGSFLIRAVERGVTAGSICYVAGEAGDKSMDVAVSGAKLVLEFVPEPGKDWLLNGLIVTRRIPHIGHIPVYSVTPGSTTTFTATITAPEGISSVDLHLSVGNRIFVIPMLPEGMQFTGQIHWLPAWGGSEAAYYITALDRGGHTARRPPDGAVQVRILPAGAAQDRPGRDADRLLIQSAASCNPSR